MNVELVFCNDVYYFTFQYLSQNEVNGFNPRSPKDQANNQ